MPPRDDSHVLDFLRQAEQGPAAPPAEAGNSPRGSWLGSRQRLAAHWDAVQTTDENERHWANADWFSARAAGNIQVRRLFRNRSRYEYANNSYYQGMVLTLANHVIGKGPRLRAQHENGEFNRAVEQGINLWMRRIFLAESLRMSRMVKCVDGESFGVLVTNPLVPGPVQLDVRWYEGDQFATPTLLQPLPTQVDGIEFDDYGNPAWYHRLKQHPGDMYFVKNPFQFDRLPADQVMHLYRTDRPWQARGIPEAAPALPLFAMLRRFTLATVAAAETAASPAGVMRTNSAASKEAEDLPEDEWFQAIPLEYRAMLTLPAGWDLTQIKAEHPTTNHEMFVRALLREIARCLNMPYNVAAGDSSSYNYSSGRLDHQTYFKGVDIERSFYEGRCLDRILSAWLDEALLVPGLLPDIGPFDVLPHKWFWDAIEDIDPTKTSAADSQKLSIGSTNRERMYAEDGLDVDEEDERAAKTYGVTVEAYRAALFAKTLGPAAAPGLPANGAAPPGAGKAPGQAAGDDEEGDEDLGTAPPGKAPVTRVITPNAVSPNTTNQVKGALADAELLTASADQADMLAGCEEGDGRSVSFLTADGDPTKQGPPRFNMVAYTGGRLFVPIRPHPVVVDLDTLQVPSQQLPALRDHKLEQIVGHTDSITIAGSGSSRRIEAAGVASGPQKYSGEVIEADGNGFPWQSSIGAQLNRDTTPLIPKGQKVSVNGRTFDGPVYVARNAMLAEISFTAKGADEGGATARIAASANLTSNTKDGSAMNFEEFLAATGLEPDKLTDVQKQGLRAKFDEWHTTSTRLAELEAAGRLNPNGGVGNPPGAGAGNAGFKDPDDMLKAMRSTAAGERKRIDRLHEICMAGGNAGEKLEAKAIEEGWSAERCELEVLRASRANPSPGRGFNPAELESGANGAPRHSDILEASLLLASGHITEDQCGEQFAENVMHEAVSRRYRGASLHTAMDFCLRAAGRDFTGNRKSDDFIRAAFEADNFLRATEGFATLSLSNILENAAGKMLLAAYTAVEVQWPNITAPRSHVDFKAHARYRLDSTGSMRKVGTDGELKQIGLTDAKYPSQLDTYGAMLTLSRQMFFNDDLGSFMYIPAMMGRLYAIRLEEGVFVLVLSNPSVGGNNFFSVANGNYLTGAGSALSIAALTAGRKNFRNRVDVNKKPILVSPNILLAGTNLETTANQLWASEKVMVTTTANTPQFNDNPFKGLYKPSITPYLNNTGIQDENGAAIANQSDTRWYLFADPAIRCAVGVAFLNGNQTPILQFAEANFNVLGMHWRCFGDFAVGLEDPNAALMNDGA